MGVQTSTTTVYHGGGRRWFTRFAAEKAEARAIIKKRCECDKGDDVTPPYVCTYHNDTERYQRLVHLLVVMFVRPSPSPAVVSVTAEGK
jgi:hypothetical protein